ncbi:MAG: hypothetical protein C0602_03320 [Denitrovibrio sp.]|nr:MAG: hypothetical protein C0602_03320 [Denitrovibrio sp.]
MYIFNLFKSSRYFFTLMACMFAVFIIIILLVGRSIYDNQREKLYSSKTNELSITKTNFEHRLEDIELEMRRLVNVMKQMNLFENPNEVDIESFASDFLFDHNYLSVIIDNKDVPDLKMDSQTFQPQFKDFIQAKPENILKSIDAKNAVMNKITINSELNVVFLVKSIHSATGIKDKNIIFFFSPELLLKYLPKNYAFLMSDGNVKWAPDGSDFPQNLPTETYNQDSGQTRLNDTHTVFYTSLSGKGNPSYLASIVDTSEIKQALLYYTLVTVVLFSLFFALIIFIIYIRNQQITQLINTQKATVVCLANLAEFKDNETADHLERTRHYGNLLSNYLRKDPKYKQKINKEYIDNIGFASVLHDIGKVGVPDSILKKPGKLTAEEFDIIKQHTVFAKKILSELVDKHKINDIFFTLSYNIATYHHEKWDGTGYPEGLKGEEIPLEARIFGLCDVYDALRSERVYKAPFSHEKSVAIINSGAGTHFDSDIVDAFNACAEQFRHIHDTYILFYNGISYSSFGNNRRELKVEWNSSLSVGIDSIDEQHKILLGKINFLIKSILDGKGDENVLSILNFLRDYSENHFRAEEKIMLELNDPYLKEHVQEHDIFRQNFKKIIDQVTQEGVQEGTLFVIERDLISWLLDHIANMDTQISKSSAQYS